MPTITPEDRALDKGPPDHWSHLEPARHAELRRVDRATWALLAALGEDPRAFHTRADFESGAALTDHAIPLWLQAFWRRAAMAVMTVTAEAQTVELRKFDVGKGFPK